ncbi:MAG: hypothetical protein A3A27_00545 [Candidatus Wildermuthbacteria bacterium RIFCSPLOWO2_01_FULL_47_18]|uniref:Uncharacterized protein n=1 Tax=Candidatus Wildermuthbacteria bacterium RIFCSPLOWO2_01_FULL_47_18 TaxID=1802460 RepID=A0A1G2RIC9_9BACT|nr:MAG: hypothetical protein A3A27_00545 [Candidatus Wildermuthbacteria bacterium RIFCSPLOWO2_01_FULL_47_18]
MNLVPRIPSKKSALQKIFGYVPLNLHLRSKKPPLHSGQRSAPLGSVTPFLIQVSFGLPGLDSDQGDDFQRVASYH